MSRVKEIEAAIESLGPDDFRQIADWCRQRADSLWDEQIDSDSASGKLDFLFDEAEREAGNGPLEEWPPSR